MNASSHRRRALDHLPWSKSSGVETAPVFKPRTVEFYRGGKDNFTAFPYDKVIWVNFWKSRGVIVHFASHTIHIAGSDIVAVYEGLRDQTLKSVGPAEDPVGPRTTTTSGSVPMWGEL